MWKDNKFKNTNHFSVAHRPYCRSSPRGCLLRLFMYVPCGRRASPVIRSEKITNQFSAFSSSIHTPLGNLSRVTVSAVTLQDFCCVAAVIIGNHLHHRRHMVVATAPRACCAVVEEGSSSKEQESGREGAGVAGNSGKHLQRQR